ncbi:MAG TPA: hypothetical protein VK966_10885, partial [Longimicrobiales bacterium]|nr:hypothetical protein [Longimicrobiales bacterium]
WRSSGTYSVVAGVAEFGGSWGFTGGIDAAAHGRLTDWFGVALGVLAGGSGEGFYLVPRGGLSLTF